MMTDRYPALDDLRTAGMNAMVARLREEMEAPLRRTRRGRLILRLARWYVGLRRWARARQTTANTATPPKASAR